MGQPYDLERFTAAMRAEVLVEMARKGIRTQTELMRRMGASSSIDKSKLSRMLKDEVEPGRTLEPWKLGEQLDIAMALDLPFAELIGRAQSHYEKMLRGEAD